MMKSGASTEKVQQIFSSIAPTYDLVNDILTFGLARHWRSRLVKSCRVANSMHVLDCATGTGDVAIEWSRQVPGLKVSACDFSREMLALAPEKARAQKADVGFFWADLTKLPFADSTFGACTIAYGLRNVVDRSRGLNEMIRVTRPGGRIGILETGSPESKWFAPFLKFYFKIVVPFVGGLFSGHASAYDYLNTTSLDFPSGAQMIEWLKSHPGVEHVEHKTLMGGASHLYVLHRSGRPAQ